MLNNWEELLTNTRKGVPALSSTKPKAIAAFQRLNTAQGLNGDIDV